MIPRCRIYIVIVSIAALVFLAAPVGATVVLSDESFSPNPPFIVNGQQHMTAKYAILPSGSTTFIKGHELQMQTDLNNAQWNIQVMVDNQNAAQQTASGTAAFINGELLSYPTSRDVTLVVTIDGTVPQKHQDQLMVLQTEEIDNSGNVVTGSVNTISQPVAGQVTPLGQAMFPTHTPPLIPQLPLPTTVPGFSLQAVVIALGAMGIIRTRHRE